MFCCLGEKIFHVLPRDKKYNDALRTKTAADFEEFVKSEPYATITVKAGEGVIMPGNMIHRVYTVYNSVALGCNFLTEPQMETAIATWHFEKTKVKKELKKSQCMRELQESNLFINFQAIAMIWFFRETSKLRLELNRCDQAKLKLLKKLFKLFENTPRDTKEEAEFKKTKDLISRNWIQQRVGNVDVVPFDYSTIQQYISYNHL